MSYENVLVETVEGGVGVVTLNRPKVLNALSFDLARELDEAVSEFEKDPNVKAVIITGSGERAFSAGADIHEGAQTTPEQSAERGPLRAGYTWHLATLRKPTIGAINGLCYGGAAVLASTLDVRIGCERSSFRFIAAARGRLNSTWCLPVVVGWARAKELLYTARVVEAEEAESVGLLNKIVPSEKLMDEAIAMGRIIAQNNPDMVQGAKQLLHEHIGLGWQGMYDRERAAVTMTLRPGPMAEGFAEFLNRKGRR